MQNGRRTQQIGAERQNRAVRGRTGAEQAHNGRRTGAEGAQNGAERAWRPNRRKTDAEQGRKGENRPERAEWDRMAEQ